MVLLDAVSINIPFGKIILLDPGSINGTTGCSVHKWMQCPKKGQLDAVSINGTI